jgi:hypothetical protein
VSHVDHAIVADARVDFEVPNPRSAGGLHRDIRIFRRTEAPQPMTQQFVN